MGRVSPEPTSHRQNVSRETFTTDREKMTTKLQLELSDEGINVLYTSLVNYRSYLRKKNGGTPTEDEERVGELISMLLYGGKIIIN